MRRLTAMAVAAGLLLAFPASAAAAPPTNDLPAGAIALPGTLPITITQDTTEATVTPADDIGCGAGGQDQATVWYTFTPATSGRLLLDSSASSFGAGINIWEGAPSAETILDCFGPTGIVEFTGGTLYTLMFADADFELPNGGQLSVTIDAAPPPIEVTLDVDPVGKVQQKAGTVVVSGTIACDAVPEFAFIELNLRQRVGKYVIRGFGATDVACGPDPVEWSAEISPDNGRFAGGKASLDVLAVACDPIQCGEVQQTFSVRLRR